MADTHRLKENYRLAGCCNPVSGDEIVGFLKIDSLIISVHKASCKNLEKVAIDRLVTLKWDEIVKTEIDQNLSEDIEYEQLDDIDFKILEHHQVMGVDYAAVVARTLKLPRQTVFERHRKLKELRLLKRIRPRIIQYRKNIVKNKWIKHRNHTYYEITPKGCEFLKHHSLTY
jgi:(p)ppGpp synthase/HD superfamily hydrolase